MEMLFIVCIDQLLLLGLFYIFRFLTPCHPLCQFIENDKQQEIYLEFMSLMQHHTRSSRISSRSKKKKMVRKFFSLFFQTKAQDVKWDKLSMAWNLMPLSAFAKYNNERNVTVHHQQKQLKQQLYGFLGSSF